MKKLLLSLLLFSFPILSQGEEMLCHTKNEVGERKVGTGHIFERTDDLGQSTKPSIIDFDKLTITNADTGDVVYMTQESNNHFTIGNFHYLTNDARSIVIEASFQSSADNEFVYSKILMCDPA